MDELELAPTWVQDRLLKLLRSTDERMLFKLALSPFVFTETLREVTSPIATHDYDAIQLWFGEKDDARLREFCRKIWSGTMKGSGPKATNADWALGRSKFDLGRDAWASRRTSYYADSSIAGEFRSLAKKDMSFRRYINRRQLDPDRWVDLSGSDRAKSIRKIQHVVIARNYFRNVRRLRSRKSKALYCGSGGLFAVSEGNPRILKAIMAHLQASWRDRQRPIPARLQSDAMMDAAVRFEALLATVPIPQFDGRLPVGVPSLVELLSDIAEYLHRVAIEDDFQEEPPGSFKVDRSLRPSILEVLRSGLNMGGVVVVENSRDMAHGGLSGARLRLSYLVAMKYNSLIRLGRAINLSTMVPKLKEASRLPGDADQLSLLTRDKEGQDE